MKNLVKAVKLSQPAIKTTAAKVLYALKRDSEDLRKYGITAQMIGEFETKVNNLDATGTDTAWRKLTTIKVSDLDTAKNNLLSIIKVIGFNLNLAGESQQLRLAYALTKSLYKLMRVELQRAALDLIEKLDENRDEVLAAGVTEDQLAELQSAYDSFVSQIADKLDTHQVRKATTENRNNDFMDVYNLASRYAEIGKEHWKNLSPVKYRDYVLLTSSGDKASPPAATAQVPSAEKTTIAPTAEVATTLVGTVATKAKAS